MKGMIMNRLFRFMTIGLILCIVFVTGCSKSIQELTGTVSPKLTNTIKTLKFEEIKSAKIQLGTAEASPIKYDIFNFNNPDHTKVIKDVVHYLNTAKIQGNAYEQIVNDKGGTNTYLILTLKDGSVIEIKYAIHDSVKKNLAGSSERAKNLIPNEVEINIVNSNVNSIRILSPEIKNLIFSGHKDIFKSTVITVTNFNIPNQILVYKNGKEKKILKDDNKYAEILKLSDNRIGINVDQDQLKLFIPKESIEKLKKTETFIEFVYSEQQKKIGNLEQKYIGLIFPLTGEYRGYCLFEQGSNGYSGPISNLGSPDSLLNLLK